MYLCFFMNIPVYLLIYLHLLYTGTARERERERVCVCGGLCFALPVCIPTFLPTCVSLSVLVFESLRARAVSCSFSIDGSKM